MEDQWLTWAKRLQAIARAGPHFGEGDFDTERYKDIPNISNGILSSLGQIPISRIKFCWSKKTRRPLDPARWLRRCLY